MNLIRYRPRTMDLFNWDRSIDRVMDRFFEHGFFDDDGVRGRIPAVDVRETDKDYLMEIELPGMSEKDVEVRVENGVLTVSSDREESKEEKKHDFIRRERRRSSFCRSFRLPENVKAEKIDATFKNGLLTVSMPKVPEARPKKIEVKAL